MSRVSLSVAHTAMAMSLTTLLVSCSATRSAAPGPTNSWELAKYAIVFEPQPDGLVAHSWIPLTEFALSQPPPIAGTLGTRRNIVRVVAGLNEYCDGRHDQCVEDCLQSSRPFVIGGRKYMDTQAQPWRIARNWWCPSNCMEEMIKCKKGRGEWAEQHAEFDAIDPAIDWIKKHREELAVGAVVVITGVAFTVVVAGTGGAALALVPLLVIAEMSPRSSSEPLPVEARR